MDVFISQLFAVSVIIAAGLFTAFLFDCYKVVRGLAKPGRLFTNLGDVIYCVIITIVVFGFLLYGNWGELRLYVFLAWALGIFIYEKAFSRLVLRLLIKFTRTALRLIRFLWRTVKKVWSVACKLGRILGTGFMAILSVLYYPIAFCLKILKGVKRRIRLPIAYLFKEKKEK